MRAGDFSGTTIAVKDPLTGLPFPGNVIPANRLDPSAQNIVNFFYPLPNQGTLATGMGVYQQFVPETANRHRADLRIDHEASSKDSLFLRASYQRRDPAGISFEAGNGLTNLGHPGADPRHRHRGRGLDEDLLEHGRQRVPRRLQLRQQRPPEPVQRPAGQRPARPRDRAERRRLPRRLPVLQLLGRVRGQPAREHHRRRLQRRPDDQPELVLDQQQPELGRRAATRCEAAPCGRGTRAIDGRGRGTNHRGQYRFNGAQTGNALADLLLGYTRDVADRVSTRGDTDGYSNDFAVFLQDDWRVNNDLTVFLGLRYELAGAWNEKGDILGNFVPEDGGYHVVPNAQVAALLPPGLQALGRTRIASDVDMPNTLINSDKNNFSPRVGFAWRVGGNDQTVVRGGFGLFHPTVAIQGLRDLLASNMFRYGATRTAPPLHAGLQRRRAVRRPRRLRQPGYRRRRPEPGHLPVQPHPRAGAGRRVRPARQLHRLDDAEAARRPRLQHDAGQHGLLRPLQPRRPRAPAVPPVRVLHGQRRQPGRGPAARGPGRAAAPLEGRPGAQRGLHATPTRAATPPTPATAPWAS